MNADPAALVALHADLYANAHAVQEKLQAALARIAELEAQLAEATEK